jgi:hypothetical protein
MDAGSHHPSDLGSRQAIVDQVLELIKDGRKLHAIDQYMKATGVDLVRAKLAVDNIEGGRPLDTPPPEPWQSVPLSPERLSELASKLPSEWPLSRVQELEPSAELLDPRSHPVQVGTPGHEVESEAEVIVHFGPLCLVRLCGEAGWEMGQIDSTGSIWCWGDYGNDLGKAIDAL